MIDDNIGSQILSVAEAFFLKNPLSTETERNVMRQTTMVVLKWMPYAAMVRPIVAHMEYDEARVDRDAGFQMGQQMCENIVHYLKDEEKDAKKWRNHEAKVYNRVWRRAWRYITAPYRKMR